MDLTDAYSKMNFGDGNSASGGISPSSRTESGMPSRSSFAQRKKVDRETSSAMQNASMLKPLVTRFSRCSCQYKWSLRPGPRSAGFAHNVTPWELRVNALSLPRPSSMDRADACAARGILRPNVLNEWLQESRPLSGTHVEVLGRFDVDRSALINACPEYTVAARPKAVDSRPRSHYFSFSFLSRVAIF